jgi:hypothetical protein
MILLRVKVVVPCHLFRSYWQQHRARRYGAVEASLMDLESEMRIPFALWKGCIA